MKRKRELFCKPEATEDSDGAGAGAGGSAPEWMESTSLLTTLGRTDF